jgi:transcriptional antiterminator NusG
MWYVVQVVGGKEKRALTLIKKMIDNTMFEECFIPQYEVMKKSQGQWQKCTRTLFPGYLFLITDCVDMLAQELHHVPAFTKLLSSGGEFIPLNIEEIAWISALTRQGSRVIEMSVGIIEGDRIIILEGPLMNLSGLIRKIDRHKRVAYLDLGMFGRSMTIKVGVEIIKKR